MVIFYSYVKLPEGNNEWGSICEDFLEPVSFLELSFERQHYDKPGDTAPKLRIHILHLWSYLCLPSGNLTWLLNMAQSK